ncbi:hypothetical protein [Leclercia adecarboxylata]|uniref:hypothetical protein n=1 Tax=Leclercia adecarboxylata TaxID=83655 RepID=UPI002B2A204F|nr:hypothetical protein NRF19_21550 [Leclercia adecarboxylata]
MLANHCERFAQTLLETDDAAEKLERVMEGLLYYRVSFYADTLNADCKHRMDTWQLIRLTTEFVGRANAVPPGATLPGGGFALPGLQNPTRMLKQ